VTAKFNGCSSLKGSCTQRLFTAFGSRVGWFVVRGCWVGWSAGGWGVHDPGLFYASSSPVSPSKIKIKNKVKIKIKIKVKIRVKIKVKPMVKG
jgi:hypothetical protein